MGMTDGDEIGDEGKFQSPDAPEVTASHSQRVTSSDTQDK
jgi:hypothetical protein